MEGAFVMTIEEVLIARQHERLRVSIFPASTGYQASLSGDNGKSWRVEMAATPDVALQKVLGILPGASGPLWAAPATGSVFE